MQERNCLKILKVFGSLFNQGFLVSAVKLAGNQTQPTQNDTKQVTQIHTVGIQVPSQKVMGGIGLEGPSTF